MEQRAIREVNSSIYCFTLEKLWPCLASLRPENAHRELYLTDVIAVLRASGNGWQTRVNDALRASLSLCGKIALS